MSWQRRRSVETLAWVAASMGRGSRIIMTAAVSPYRGIRATMEQPSVCIGLDHDGRGCLGRGGGEAITVVGRGIDPGAARHVRCSRSPGEAADTVRDPCWQRPDLTWKRSLGLSLGARGWQCACPGTVGHLT
jgi:hypothetical protein